MIRLLKFLLGIFVLVLVLNWLLPSPHPPAKTVTEQTTTHRIQGSPITLGDVSEKSRDALTITAAYMHQEKKRIEAAMAVTLQKLDRLIAQMQAQQSALPTADRSEWQHRIHDWETTRDNVVELQSRLRPAENSTIEQIKTNWQSLEVDISHRMMPDSRKESAHGAKAFPDNLSNP